MSSMLEQAIIDATALREAALKNAEAAIIEKYAPEIKSAVDTLLEQEPTMGALDDEPIATPIEPAAPEVDAPLAGLDGTDACPCPDDGEEIELTLESLQAMAAALVVEDAKPDFPDIDDDGNRKEPISQAAEDKEEAVEEATEEEGEFVLDEAAIAALVEELVVDITPQKSGWAGTPEPIMQHIWS